MGETMASGTRVWKETRLYLAKLQNSNNKITEAIVKTNDFSVIQTEVTFTNFIVQNNLTISVADKAGNLFRKMSPDSECVKRYGCQRIKTTAILQRMIFGK
jgi:hypothetical protein